MQEEKAGSSVKSLQVALDILEAISDARDEVGISELSSRLGLTKGSVFRYVKTLTERGYLNQNAITQRYGLGTRLHIMGELASSRIDLLMVAEPVMRQLRDQLSLTVNLAGIGNNGVVILKSLVGTLVMEIGVRVGSELPFGVTSQGRVIMAFSRRPLLASAKRQKPDKFTQFTSSDPNKMEQQVELARKRGWAAAPQETVVGINAVSVPLFAADGDCIAAVTLVGSLQYLPEVPELQQLEVLAAAGERISASLGYRGSYPRPTVS
ncbi:IclR family transcriptional regulator [Rhizobium sp. SG741]|uniref:IclR family transcriptional regulator n=1 Tax=Rhizobium sp. SG741 TaxID=2587114 RepID=UPI0014452EAF|nr:IclR family transcriptional regulator [Rhizobium sp. SG741]NKJ08949.1 DNA-binding IclR family transcriptional regulator [Rhizobium sp. SG741]